MFGGDPLVQLYTKPDKSESGVGVFFFFFGGGGGRGGALSQNFLSAFFSIFLNLYKQS